MKEPRDLVQRFEKNPQLPKGDGEIPSVYGVESCPFASGDILCSRHVLASSFGPAYTAIWHRDPDGDWRFYQDVPPRQGCPRFFGKALAGVTLLPIETHWDGPRRLRIVAPGRIEWQFDLSSTLATRVMNLMGSVMPDTLWKNPTVLAAMAPVAGVALGAGKLRLTDGRNLGAVVPLRKQSKLGDFWIPRTGLFAIGRAFFDAFDPNIHSAATSRTECVANDSSTRFAAA